MGDSEARITRIVLPDGTPVWARISGAEELERARPSTPGGPPGGQGEAPGGTPGGLSYSDTGFAEQVQARVESLQGVVTGVARSLAEPLRAVRPDEVSVEFGIELTAKAGKVVGLLADGEAKGAIKVTLTWNGGGPPVDAPPAPTVPPQTATPPAPPMPPAPPTTATGGWTAPGMPAASGAPGTPGAPVHPDGATPPGGGGS
ncbi:CU044_2847 family protein [Streptomyces sp. NPDC059909]|uniref:CU044_2847 family protein n=1 Tax=Streptomyces sp. NPDC059909 TaxID=3346998 RepID=UPI003661B8EA